MNKDRMIRAGNDLVLGNSNPSNTAVSNTATHVAALRKSVHNIYYAVAQSNAVMTYTGEKYARAFYSERFSMDISSSIVSFRGGQKTYVVEGNLPKGLTFNASLGTITGVPDASAAGVKYNIKVKALLNGTVLNKVDISIVVPGLSYTGSAISAGKVDTAFTASVASAASITGESASYKLKSGSTLPAGLTLASNGMITGTPTTAGTTNIVVIASAPGVPDVEAQFAITIGAKDMTLQNELKEAKDEIETANAEIELLKGELETKGSSTLTTVILVLAIVGLASSLGLACYCVLVLRKKK